MVAHAFSRSHTHTHTHTHTLSVLLMQHAQTYTLTPSHTHCLTHTHPPTHTHTDLHTHTHAHMLFFLILLCWTFRDVFAANAVVTKEKEKPSWTRFIFSSLMLFWIWNLCCKNDCNYKKNCHGTVSSHVSRLIKFKFTNVWIRLCHESCCSSEKTSSFTEP